MCLANVAVIYDAKPSPGSVPVTLQAPSPAFFIRSIGILRISCSLGSSRSDHCNHIAG